MGHLTDLIIQQTDLILRLARQINNTDKLSLHKWTDNGMNLLSEVQQKYPEDYDSSVLGEEPNFIADLKPSKEDEKTDTAVTQPKKLKQSIYVRNKERQAKEYTENGVYENERSPWTPKQLDILLDGFLYSRLPMLSKDERQSLVKECKRPVKAIQKALWRLAVRDANRKRFYNYKPTYERFRRTDSGLYVWDRDDILIAIHLGTGICSLNWLERLLQRREEDILEHMIEIWDDMNSKRPRLRKAEPFNYMDSNHVHKLHKFMQRHGSKQITEFTSDDAN